MEEKLRCNTCGKEILNDTGSTKFKCPNCERSTIIRCYHCREIAARYKCPACGFEGPN